MGAGTDGSTGSGSSSIRLVMWGAENRLMFRATPVFSGEALLQSCKSLGITRGDHHSLTELHMIPYSNIPLEFPFSCTGTRGQAILAKLNSAHRKCRALFMQKLR